MCTLTYFLKEKGYELFFNRDEQHHRKLAIPADFHQEQQAIYPIDPEGNGTWIAVNRQGLSLALLNYYQGEPQVSEREYTSRGQLILSLLNQKQPMIEQLTQQKLTQYQPFQLCIFPEQLSLHQGEVASFIWDGIQLMPAKTKLPIISSSVRFDEVYKKRQHRFTQIIDLNHPSTDQFKAFHYSTEQNSAYSVNLYREKVRTVSISHIEVSQLIAFTYYDNVNAQTYHIQSPRDIK